ncbi:MAG: hypothetical protein Q7T05_08475 [Dehalococcoidia bacterium]|nr:hypothetical protein [Dehalococcoidia bacterium]
MSRRVLAKAVGLAMAVFTLALTILWAPGVLGSSTVTLTMISDTSGATQVVDEAGIPPGSAYPPGAWSPVVYAWGAYDGAGTFWNSMLFPPAEKTELLGSGAQWVWKPEETAPIALGDGRTVYKITPAEAISGDIVKLKRTFNIPSGATAISGRLVIATDNAFYAYFSKNFAGVPFAQGNFNTGAGFNYSNFRDASGFPIEDSVESPGIPWTEIHAYDVSSQLAAGANTLELVATNEHGPPSVNTPESNPAGMIYMLTVTYTLNGTGTTEITTVGGQVYPNNLFVLVAPIVGFLGLAVIVGAVAVTRKNTARR